MVLNGWRASSRPGKILDQINLMFLRLDRIIYLLLSILETLISFRFFFKLIGANPSNFLVSWLYKTTGFFVMPFKGILEDFALGRFTVDLTAIIALVVYSFAGFVIIELLRLFRFDSDH